MADAPVAFPEIWNAPSFDWVQYGGQIRQPMGRNIAQVLGVAATVELSDDPASRYASSIRVRNLQWAEERLRELRSPPWPAAFGSIDQDQARRGGQLCADRCALCHDFAKNPDGSPRDYTPAGQLRVKMFRQDVIGTDSTHLTNFVNRTADTGPLGLGSEVSAATALTAITTAIASKQYATLGLSQDEIDAMNCCAENEFRAEMRLRPRQQTASCLITAQIGSS